jgi:hypothetical protein
MAAMARMPGIYLRVIGHARFLQGCGYLVSELRFQAI